MKTLPKAVSHTGLRTAILTLLPSQVDLVNRPFLRQVFLVGPPGTGKTVVLGIKGLQWRKQRKDVHLLSSHDESVAATFLIEHQLTHALPAAADSGSPGPRVQSHMYDFKTNPGDVQAAVNTLANAADDELYVIADEAYNGSSSDDVKHVALADMNVVTLTDWKIVSSLERRVVIGLGSTGWNGHGRLFVKSRSTAFLVWIDPS
nr:hypothetical protein BaRGS_016847 [Batillaria attramentaria]